MTVGATAIAFEAPGEKLYAQRLGFIFENEDDDENENYSIYHIGNTADPIFSGSCRGLLSACEPLGYALETKCHVGTKCVYKVPNAYNDVRYHQITNVIARILMPRNQVPLCRRISLGKGEDDGCRDCSWWDFDD